MSSLVSPRMSDLYGPLNYSRGAAALSSTPPGFSSAGLTGLSASSASCGSDFRRVSPSRGDLDPSFPSDYTSDDSSGSTDVHNHFRQRNRTSANQEPLSSANRNRKRSRRPEMDGNADVMHDMGSGGGAFNSVVAPKVVRQTANARERDRTHSVNSAFVILRTMIPTEPADRKLSKIETLRLATSYISHLHTMLLVGLDVRDQPCHKHQGLVGGRRTGGGRGAEDGRSTSVCTFCLTGSKASKAKSQSVRPEQCMFPDRRMHHLR